MTSRFVDRHRPGRENPVDVSQAHFGLLWIVYVAATAVLFAAHVYHDVRIFPHDAREYWSQAAFDLTIDRTRGYLFAFFLAPFNSLLELSPTVALWSYRLGGAALCAALFVFLLPAAFVTAFGGHASPWRRLVPPIAIVMLYPGVIIYPLSDLPALLLCWGGLFAALRLPAVRHDDARTAGVNDAPVHRRHLLLAAASGACMAGAYNTRPIYIVSGLSLFVALCVSTRLAGRARWRAGAVMGFAIGAAIVSLPQAVNNQIAYGRFTANPSPRANLFAFQLYAGLEVQRYETTTEPDGRYAGVPYVDRSGRSLMREAGLDPGDPDFGDYLEAFAAHPLEMLGIYGRHFVNGLDLRDGRAYIKRASPTRDGPSFMGFTLLALAAWILMAKQARSQARGSTVGSGPTPGAPPVSSLVPLAVLLLPVALITPGAMETRFYLPLHLLAWSVVAFKLEPAVLQAHAKAHGLTIPIAFLIGLAVFYGISTATMAQ